MKTTVVKIALVAVSVICAISPFLPWLSYSWFNETVHENPGLEEGYMWLVSGAVTAILALIAIFVKHKALPIVTGITGIAMSLWAGLSSINFFLGSNILGIERNIGIGAYISLVGAIGMLVASILVLAVRPKEDHTN